MNGKTKSNSVVTTLVNEDIGEIVFNVRDAGTLTLHVERLSNENRGYAEIHGLIQRVSDGAALSRNRQTGKPASPADKLAAMQEIVTHLESGSKEWRLAGTARGLGDYSILVQALVAHTGKSQDAIRAYLEKKTTSEQRTILNSEKILPIANRIRAEAAKNVDTDELLADFDSDEEA